MDTETTPRQRKMQMKLACWMVEKYIVKDKIPVTSFWIEEKHYVNGIFTIHVLTDDILGINIKELWKMKTKLKNYLNMDVTFLFTDDVPQTDERVKLWRVDIPKKKLDTLKHIAYDILINFFKHGPR